MKEVNLQELLEAGVHFGHQVRRSNPKMLQFIYTAREGVHIIDLTLTAQYLDKARSFIKELATHGGEILFVGTKRQAKDIVKEEAENCGMNYVSERWVGGLLTNWEQMHKSIRHMTDMKKARNDGTWSKYNKKEQAGFKRELERLEKMFSGVEGMTKLPDALFIVDVNKEKNAVIEATKRQIPVVGVVDTNCNPDIVDYVIPANDDAIRSIKLMASYISEAISEGKGDAQEKVAQLKKKEEKIKEKEQKAKEKEEVIKPEIHEKAEEIEERLTKEEIEKAEEETRLKAQKSKE